MKIYMKDCVGKGQLRNTDVQLDKPSHEKKGKLFFWEPVSL